MKLSAYIFGWSTIVISFLLIISELVNLALNASVDQVTGLLGGYAGLKASGLGPLMELFTYNRIWSIYSIAYFLVTLGGGIQFIRLRESGRKTLEVASWVGLLNACIETCMTYMFWSRMEASMSATAGGSGLTLVEMNPLGLGTIILGFFLWVIPSGGIIVYLRRSSLRALMNSGKPPVQQGADSATLAGLPNPRSPH